MSNHQTGGSINDLSSTAKFHQSDRNTAHSAIAQALALLHEPSAVFEVRCPKGRKNGTVAGYFNCPEAAAQHIVRLNGQVPGIYVTLNPPDPTLLARANNRLIPRAEHTTQDADVLRRRWLLIDADPKRPSGISSNAEEHRAALTRIIDIRNWLASQGWPEPLLADSGNGGHLLYRIELANDADTTKLIKRCLQALATWFDDDYVEIDRNVFNASRISKIYGTVACKGDALPDRPHRTATLLDVPAEVLPVSHELLQALANTLPTEPSEARAPSTPRAGSNDFFRRVNDHALANLSTWVTALFPQARSYQQGYRIPAKMLDRNLEEDIGIQPTGIVDFGIHDQGDPREGKRTPIDLVMEWGGPTNAKEASHWLCQQMGIDPASFGWQAINGKVCASSRKGTASLEEARAVVESAIKSAPQDCGAPFEEKTLEALRLIQQRDKAAYARYRAQFKAANKNILITHLDQIIKGEDSTASDSESTTDLLVTMVRNAAELFHDGDKGYASFDDGDHQETWPLDSRGFREWLTARFYRETSKSPRDASITDALVTLNGIAKFDGARDKVWLRCAVHEGRYYLDLCNEGWQAIEIGTTGWQVVDRPPVRFRRTSTMEPLPLPERGGDLALMWETVNIADADRPLILAYILECWRPETPFIIKEAIGEQGTGKSDTDERLRLLIDPSSVNLRAAPAKTEDIFVAAANNWLVSFNNLSHLTATQQDALCTLATGGGFAGRTLYTNTEETLVDVQRPVSLNGINGLATAQDLLDRTLRLELPLIQNRRLDSELKAQFEQDRPGILGALLDLFSNTLRELPSVRLDNPPRMADFTTLGEAMFKALNRNDKFTELYRRKQAESILAALEASPVAAAVLAFMENRQDGYEGTVKDLLEKLGWYRQDSEAWPKSAKGLADALRRNAPGLRMAGIGVFFDAVRRKRGYHVSLKSQKSVFSFFGNFKESLHEVHQVRKVRSSLNYK